MNRKHTGLDSEYSIVDEAFVAADPLRTAVLLVVFNRPEQTRRVVEAVRIAKPPRLYVAADGPRSGRVGENELCDQTRRIAANVDWPCSVRTLFRDRNLGCRDAVSSAINWFFQHESEGIIVEDDCVPSQSFFWFCEEMLGRYRTERAIMAVGGSNYQGGIRRGDASYYFSKYFHCWGWATWRRAWQLYDRDLIGYEAFREGGGLARLSEGRRAFVSYWHNIFSGRAASAATTWDYAFTFACWKERALSITPQVNLVTNIGFDSQATHTGHEVGSHKSVARLDLLFPLRHPERVVRDTQADTYTDRYHFRITLAAQLWRFAADKWPWLRSIRSKATFLRRM